MPNPDFPTQTDSLPQKKIAVHFQELGVLSVLIIISVILSFLTPNFKNPNNLMNILRQFSEISIMSIGMTFIIINAEIDLSVGSTYGFAGITAAFLLHNGFPPTVAFLVAIGSGLLIGFINGFFVTVARIPAFIATLGMMQVVRGGAFAISKGWPISDFPSTDNWFFFLGEKLWNVIPVQVIIMFALNIAAAILLGKTKFGFKTYAVGGNEKAARLAGVSITRIKILAFMIMGALSALGGTIGLAYLNSVAPTSGTGREMDVIAAVIIGGTKLSGGKGTILCTFIGAAIMGVVRNGMVLLGVRAYFQEALIGAVILIAVLADTWLIKKD
jgi:simple sugar transport system permease protein/ribose transport system permease protein